jgi:hypothetical protein
MAKLYPDIEKIVVRCCLLCNILISNRPLNSIKERAEFLYFKYPVKYKALLSLPDWSDEELDELSGYLRLKITKEIKKKRIFEDKLKFLQNFIITFAND